MSIMNMADTVVLFLVCVISTCIDGQVPVSPRVRLASALLHEERYQPSIMPSIESKGGITVNVSFTLATVLELDERSQTLTSLGYLDMRWYDELLRWNPGDYGNITSIVLHPDQVWLPEILVINSAMQGCVFCDHSVLQQEDIALSESMRFRVQVSHTGLVAWTPAQRWETFCRSVMTFFPFDTQTCEVQIINFVNQADSGVNLELSTAQVHVPLGLERATSGEWTLASAEAQTYRLDGNETNSHWYSRRVISMTLKLERVSEFYVYNIILPIVIITQVSTLGYLLPCASGEKISLSITILLSYFVLLLMVSELMPRNGDVPYITSYIALCMFINSFTLLFSILVLNLYHHHPYSRVPKCFRSVFFSCCGKLLCCSVPSKAAVKVPKTKKRHSKQPKPIVIELNETGESSVDGVSEAEITKSNNNASQPTIVVDTHSDHGDHDDYYAEDDPHILQRNQEEWMQLATVVDRLLFMTGFFGITSVTVIYFLVVQSLTLTYDELYESITGWVKDMDV